MPSLTSSVVLAVCSAKLVFDAYFAFQEPAPVFTQDAFRSAYQFAQALQAAQEAEKESSCPAPAEPEEASEPKPSSVKPAPVEEEDSLDLVILGLVCTVGALLGLVVCLVISLRRRRAPEIRPYSRTRKHGSGAKGSRVDPDEEW